MSHDRIEQIDAKCSRTYPSLPGQAYHHIESNSIQGWGHILRRFLHRVQHREPNANHHSLSLASFWQTKICVLVCMEVFLRKLLCPRGDEPEKSSVHWKTLTIRQQCKSQKLARTEILCRKPSIVPWSVSARKSELASTSNWWSGRGDAWSEPSFHFSARTEIDERESFRKV